MLSTFVGRISRSFATMSASIREKLAAIVNGDIPQISVQEAREMKDLGEPNVYWIDVREPHELASEGAPAGAINTPLSTLSEASLPTQDRSAALLISCKSGGRSQRAAQVLHSQLGYQRVFNVSGGFMAYKSAGLPLK